LNSDMLVLDFIFSNTTVIVSNATFNGPPAEDPFGVAKISLIHN